MVDKENLHWFPHLLENTGSHSITEINQRRVELVLKWEDRLLSVTSYKYVSPLNDPQKVDKLKKNTNQSINPQLLPALQRNIHFYIKYQ